jgi:hypothetical protein
VILTELQRGTLLKTKPTNQYVKAMATAADAFKFPYPLLEFILG